MGRGWSRVTVTLCAVLLAGCHEGAPLRNAGTALEIAPAAIDFGPTALGELRLADVRIANRGSAPVRVLSISSTLSPVALPGFTELRLSSGEEREVTVAFVPRVEGEVSGALRILTDGPIPETHVALSGLGVEGLAELRTADVRFGAVAVNTVELGELVVANPRLVPVRVRLTLGGPDADEFSSTAIAGPLDLAPGQDRSVPVAFRPTRLGVAQGFIGVAVCPACPEKRVPLAGTGIASLLEISPLVVDFGRVPVGSSADARVTVRNLGSEAFDFTGAALLDDGSSAFALTSVPAPPGGRLEAGMAVEIWLRFTPRSGGPVSGGLLRIGASPAGSGAPGPKLPVLGEGGTPCLLVSPSSLDFGTVPLGMTSTLRLGLYNRCRGEVEVSGQSVSTQVGGYFSLAEGQVPIFLAGGASALLGVSFTPRAGTTRSAGLLRLPVHQADGSGGMEQVSLLGAATSLPPCAHRLAPPALDFGAVPLGAAVTLGLSLLNTGSSPCFLSSMQVAPGSDPELTAVPAGSRLLPPGAGATLRVRFQPTAVAAYAGLAEAWVNGSPVSHPVAPLSGSGSVSCFSLSPTTVDFGLSRLGCPARVRTVVGHNLCAEAVTVGPTVLEVAPGAPFSLVSGAASPILVGPGESTSWVLRYAPTAEAEDAAALRVQARGEALTAGVLGMARAPSTWTDHFVQQGQGKVDVLFVIDNSGSMMEEQASLARNLAAFISGAQLRQVDYHLAVTTTGIEPSPSGWARCPGGADGGEAGRLFPPDGSSSRVITQRTPDAARVFARNVSVGVCHWNERGLEAVRRALSSPLVDGADDPGTPLPDDGNLGFLRPDARLAVVFVSDEDDGSAGSVDSYETFLRAVKANDPTLLVVSAIVGPEGSTACGTASSPGLRYIALAQRTGGLVESICTQDWARSLENIAIGVFSPRRRFPLSQTPADPAGIVVEVNGEPVTSGWAYDAASRSVVFDPASVPGFDALVDITYSLGC